MPTAFCGVVRASLKSPAASQRREMRTTSPSKARLEVQVESVLVRSQRARNSYGCV
jgi:hypothetical protein